MKQFSRSLFLLCVIVTSSAFAGRSIATITSAEPFALDGHSVDTPGVSSFPVVVGDTVSTSKGPAVLVFSDGSAMKLGSNSSVHIAGAEANPKVVLLSGALDYKLVPGSTVSVTNLDSEHSGPHATPRTAGPAPSAFLELHPGQIAAPQTVTPPGSANNNPNVSANYIGEDAATLGNWKGKYGADGQLIASDITNPPPYATVSLLGQATPVLTADADDPRALQSASGATARVRSTYGNDFTIDLHLNDENVHKVTLYLSDMDNAARAETIAIIDPTTKTVLSTQNFSAFSRGVYESWNIKGHVLVRVTTTATSGAIVNGIFFDAAGPAAADASGDSGASPATPNTSQPLLNNPKFLIPLAAAAAAGLAAGLLSLPAVSRNL